MQYFTVSGSDNVVEVIRLEIYDRWGEWLFRRTHFAPSVESLGWDGRQRGSPVPPGVYLWQVDVLFDDGSRQMKTGTVTVVR